METLQKPDLFNRLTKEQFNEVVKSGFSKTLPSKSILFQQGDPADTCFLVNSGCLKLAMVNEEGNEVIVRYVDAGELTAAITLIKDRDYPVTAESVGETEVTGWDKQAFMGLMRDFPDIAINILGIVLERLEEVQHRYQELCTEQVERRIARTLLRLMQRGGKKTPEGIEIDIPVTRQNIADYAGTTLFTVSRTLSAWKKRGWVKSRREHITITDPHALVMFTDKG